MIVVDTSVWVDYFRARSNATVAEVQALLDQDEVVLVAPVRIELLSGARRADLARLKRVLSALPLWLPAADTWMTMASGAEKAAARGQRFGVADLLVAAMAKEHGARVWSLDADFTRMRTLGLIELYVP